jgi:hypothetical protein
MELEIEQMEEWVSELKLNEEGKNDAGFLRHSFFTQLQFAVNAQ